MNNIEKIIYDLVYETPKLKQLLRNIYQNLFDILSVFTKKRKKYLENTSYIKEGFFWGFHDISPFNADSTRILAQKLPDSFDFKIPVKEKLGIGYFNFSDKGFGDFRELSKSLAWNYHKGSRLQWVSENEIIYNSSKEGKLYSELLNTDTMRVRKIDFPIDSISSKKMLASSFSYSRLEFCMPGYGYASKFDEGYLEESISKNTGLFLIDLQSNTRKLLVSIYDVFNKMGIKDEDNAFYFITHTEFSRSSDYIAYLFRWIDKNDNSRMKRKTKIAVYSFKDEDFYILPSDFMASHFVWNDNDNILAYCTVNGQNGHVIFDISNLNDITYNIIAPSILNSDGHQSFITNDSFVTDTYPDKYRVSRIYKVETNPERIEKLVSVYSPKKFQSKTFYNHIACDLHPRISTDRKYLSFDTCYTGKRSLCVMKLSRD